MNWFKNRAIKKAIKNLETGQGVIMPHNADIIPFSLADELKTKTLVSNAEKFSRHIDWLISLMKEAAEKGDDKLIIDLVEKKEKDPVFYDVVLDTKFDKVWHSDPRLKGIQCGINWEWNDAKSLIISWVEY